MMDKAGRTQGNSNYPTFNAETVTEMKKAEEALQKVKEKIVNNPEIALDALRTLDKRSPEENQHATWTTEDIQTEVQKLDLEFVKPLLMPENPTSVEEYELKIKNEIAKTLRKRTIIHHKNPDKAHKLYLSLKNAHEAKQQRAEGDWEGLRDKEKMAEKLWREAHQADPTEQEKVFEFLGRGAFGTAESVISGEAGPMLVKKTSTAAAAAAQRRFEHEAESLQTLKHPNIIRVIPGSATSRKQQGRTGGTSQKELNFLMQSGGQPLKSLIKGVQNNKKMGSKGAEGTEDSSGHRGTAKTNLEVIKGMIRQIDANETSGDLFTKVEKMYKETSFTKRDFNELLHDINNLLKTAENPQQIESLQNLKTLSEAWKLKVPPQRDAGEPLPIKNIENITRQLLSGLSYLHEKGMVHLDIKPDNVLVQPDGTVKLIDFGLARGTDDHKNFPIICGAPPYIAPELINAEIQWQHFPDKCNETSDIYSTGCMLCELVTGKKYNWSAYASRPRDRWIQFMSHAIERKDELQKKMWDNIDASYPYEHEQQQAAQLKDLLSQMLESDPENRPSAAELLRHPFFQQGGQIAGG